MVATRREVMRLWDRNRVLRTRADPRPSKRPVNVHGPCERCGVLFYSARTPCQAICPNCGLAEACED